MTRHALAAVLFALALPAAAQVTPAANYTDMWWNPNESGWGISIAQHTATNKVFAVWYTYDPREQDFTTPETTDYKPLWIVLPDSNWTSPTTFTGNVYVTTGTPFSQAWNNASLAVQQVGTFTFTFGDSSNGTFAYNITPPAGLASSNPAFGLPTFSGVKAITRQAF